jgi:formate dehydrogenase major subunit
MNGADLQALGVGAGDVITIASRRGAVVVQARRDDGTPQGSVFMPFAFHEAAANVLTNGAIDPVGKIPEFKYCAVQVQAGGQLPAQRGYLGQPLSLQPV